MQPDPLFDSQEEKQPATLSQPDAAQSEMYASPETSQPPAGPVAETSLSAAPPAVEKKRAASRLAVLGFGVGIFLIVAVIAWVGYWAYQLSNNLTATQQQLSALQAAHEKLQADYTTLTADNAKLNEELTKAQSDLTAAQAEVKTLTDESRKLDTKLKKASSLAEILNSFFHLEDFSSFAELDAQVKAIHDPQLTKLWSDFADSPGEDSLGKFLIYLVPTIRDALK